MLGFEFLLGSQKHGCGITFAWTDIVLTIDSFIIERRGTPLIKLGSKIFVSLPPLIRQRVARISLSIWEKVHHIERSIRQVFCADAFNPQLLILPGDIGKIRFSFAKRSWT